MAYAQESTFPSIEIDSINLFPRNFPDRTNGVIVDGRPATQRHGFARHFERTGSRE